jgi:ElaB/YqjD/DUF883 family membrane-anchored ribosome-binding protein
MNSPHTHGTKNRNGHGNGRAGLADALLAVFQDAENLVQETAAQTEPKVQEARSRASESLREARARLESAEEHALESARKLVGQAEKYTRRNPWRAIGVAASAGVVVGLLVGHR